MPLGAVVGLLIAVGLVASLVLALGRTGHGSRDRVARALRWVSITATVAVALVVVRPAWADSGLFAIALVGVPLASALLVLGAGLAGRRVSLATWTAAVVMLGWSLLTSLGPGLYFLGPAVLMTAAAAASTHGRRQAAPTKRTRTRTPPGR